MRGWGRVMFVAAVAAVGRLVPAAAQASPPGVALSWSPTTSAGTFSYGSVAVGKSVSQTFTLTNSGKQSSGPVLVVLLSSLVFAKTADGCSFHSLGANQSCTVTVKYAPAKVGQTDYAVLSAVSPHALAVLELKGSGAPAKASPEITTSQQPTSATLGSSIADKATVTGFVSPSASDAVTFNLYSSATTQTSSTLLFTDTEAVSLSGSTATATSKGYTTAATRTDYWVANFNGDANNSVVSSGATAEPVTITAPYTVCGSGCPYDDLQDAISAVEGGTISNPITVGPGDYTGTNAWSLGRS